MSNTSNLFYFRVCHSSSLLTGESISTGPRFPTLNFQQLRKIFSEWKDLSPLQNTTPCWNSLILEWWPQWPLMDTTVRLEGISRSGHVTRIPTLCLCWLWRSLRISVVNNGIFLLKVFFLTYWCLQVFSSLSFKKASLIFTMFLSKFRMQNDWQEYK